MTWSLSQSKEDNELKLIPCIEPHTWDIKVPLNFSDEKIRNYIFKPKNTEIMAVLN